MKNIKKLIKNNLKVIIGIIIGIIISGITVTAATILYNANEVSFTSKYNDFTATNVNDALNVLYNKSKYFDNISVTDCMSGVYHHNSNTQWNILLQFVPSSFNVRLTNTYATFYYTYDKNKLNGSVYGVYYKNDVIGQDVTEFFNISKNITTTWSTSGNMYTNEYDIYYTVCK